jgi:molybdate transport system substrate-binding protein
LTALKSWPAVAAAPILVAAAADLQSAMPDILAAFKAKTGTEANVSFGATGNFARQIRQGAPFELFLAADESFVLALAKDGFLENEGAVYAQGRLSLVAGRQGPFAAGLSLDAIAAAAKAGQSFRMAIANPEHAPYGQRAAEVMERRGMTALLKPHLVFGENVAAALQLVASGAAAVGMVGSALAKGPAVAQAIVHADVPTDWHTPLVQRMALTKKATPAARDLYAFMSDETARAILTKHGFSIPARQG